MEEKLRNKLPEQFYLRDDVVVIAKDLLGKLLCTFKDGHLTAGVIVETEAYAGETDRASHAWQGRRTRRNEVMYQKGGTAYVYLCYGMHNLFNVVTHNPDVPHAVLIRGIHPVLGIVSMEHRRNLNSGLKGFSIGPGKVSQALGIQLSDNGLSLLGDVIWLADAGLNFTEKMVRTSTRIGVTYAGEDALQPYRFQVDSSILRDQLKGITSPSSAYRGLNPERRSQNEGI